MFLAYFLEYILFYILRDDILIMEHQKWPKLTACLFQIRNMHTLAMNYKNKFRTQANHITLPLI